MKILYFIPFFIVAGVFISAYGYNIGFQPVYQPPNPLLPYAQLSDSTTQVCPTITPANVTINTNDSIYKLSHTSSSHLVTIDESGAYQIIAVPQVGEYTPQANGEWNFWLLINGTKVANTNIKEHIEPQVLTGATFTSTLNWMGYLNENATISFQQLCTSTNIGLLATAEGTPPATPSIIISIMRIG